MRTSKMRLTRHNFKKDFAEELQPEWNSYIGKETFARTEDQYTKELKERKRRREI